MTTFYLGLDPPSLSISFNLNPFLVYKYFTLKIFNIFSFVLIYLQIKFNYEVLFDRRKVYSFIAVSLQNGVFF